MKRKIVFTSFFIFLVGGIIGGFFNFILKGEKSSVGIAIMQGFFVGILILTVYLLFILFFTLGLNVVMSKLQIIFVKIIELIFLWSGIIILITQDGMIPIPYWWMHIINLLLAIFTIYKASYDGKKYAKSLSEN